MNRRTALRLMAAGAGALAAPALAPMAAALPIATTTLGRIRGAVTRTGIHVFKRVRYGADTSRRRFLPPVAVEPESPADHCVLVSRRL